MSWPSECMNCGTVRTTAGGWISCRDKLGATCRPTGPAGDTANGYRLTVDDEQRCRQAIAEQLGLWSIGRGAAGYEPTLDDARFLVRTAARAIGCTLADLRPVEIRWLHRITSELAVIPCHPSMYEEPDAAEWARVVVGAAEWHG